MVKKLEIRIVLVAVCAAGLFVGLILNPVLGYGGWWDGSFLENFKTFFGFRVFDLLDSDSLDVLAAYVANTIFHFALVAGLALGLRNGSDAAPGNASSSRQGPDGWGTPSSSGPQRPPAS